MNVATTIPSEPESGVYLRASLAPFADILARPDVTDIYVNRPAEIWIESLGGGLERHDDPDLTELVMMRPRVLRPCSTAWATCFRTR